MLTFIQENGVLVTLICTIAAQIFMAGKIIAKNEAVMEKLRSLEEAFNNHLEDYEQTARKVSFLDGSSSVRKDSSNNS